MILHMLVQTMRFLKLMPILAASAIFLMAASCSSGKTDYESAILEWTGREIVFPDSMRLAGGGVFVKEPSDFTIVAYYDSEGCTGCRMRLPKWLDFIKILEDYAEGDVKVYMLVSPEVKRDLIQTVNSLGLGEIVVVDSSGQFPSLNNMPEDPLLQTFLLDSDNRVVLVGNPFDSLVLERLYLKAIGIDEDIISDRRETVASYDFGKIGPGESVSHTFRLTNDSDSTLRIKEVESSCPCTEWHLSTRLIQPGKEYELTVLFGDTVKGPFERVVTLKYENNVPEKRFVVSGEIK